MSINFTRALGLAAALLALALNASAASAAAPDPVAVCDGTAYTATTVAGRAAVSCDDGWIRDWQRVRVADARVDRGAGGGATLSFVVSRPEAGNPIAVDYATVDDTALAGSDYTAGSGQLVLEADETEATIDVPVTAQARAGDDRRLSLALSDPSGVAAFARDHAGGWILNRFYRVEANPEGTSSATAASSATSTVPRAAGRSTASAASSRRTSERRSSTRAPASPPSRSRARPTPTASSAPTARCSSPTRRPTARQEPASTTRRPAARCDWRTTRRR